MAMQTVRLTWSASRRRAPALEVFSRAEVRRRQAKRVARWAREHPEQRRASNRAWYARHRQSEARAPYGIPGLCRNWRDGQWAGPLRRLAPRYRATMVVSTWFGAWSV